MFVIYSENLRRQFIAVEGKERYKVMSFRPNKRYKLLEKG